MLCAVARVPLASMNDVWRRADQTWPRRDGSLRRCQTAARILLDVGDGSSFPTSGHLAAYAGLAPVTRRSGTSIRGEHPPKGGNKQLKRVFFLSAFTALSDPAHPRLLRP